MWRALQCNPALSESTIDEADDAESNSIVMWHSPAPPHRTPGSALHVDSSNFPSHQVLHQVGRRTTVYLTELLSPFSTQDLISPRPSKAVSREGSEPARLSTPRSRIETPRAANLIPSDKFGADTKPLSNLPPRSPLPGSRLATPRSALFTPCSESGKHAACLGTRPLDGCSGHGQGRNNKATAIPHGLSGMRVWSSL